jgi:dTDP-4-dehydrorhamnose reductase
MSGVRAWITGAGGLIGSHLSRGAPHCPGGGAVVGLTRQNLDLTDFAAVRQAFQRQKPELVIHCAALSKSPECQANPKLAQLLNVEVTAVLTELAADIPFIFLSTDLVFDGRTGNYDESALINPLGVYGTTKVQAERIVLANPRHTVIRTSLNGGISAAGDRGFNEQMMLAWSQGRNLRLFTDEFRCPIAAAVTARAIWELAAKNLPGLYHVAGAERLSRWQMGQLLAGRRPDLAAKIEPGSIKDYEGAPRAPDTSMSCAKAQKLLSFPLPRFSEWLAEHPEFAA